MDITAYSTVLILAFLSGMTTLIGVVLAYALKRSVNMIVVGIGFSTGIMICISVFELIPESVQSIGVIPVLIAEAAGLFLAVLANYIIPHIHLVKEENKSKHHLITAAYLIAFGLILHDFPEGFAMANSYIHTPSLGVLVALAIALHNIPEEFAMAVPLIEAGRSKKSIVKIAFVSGLAEPAGAILGLLVVSIFTGLNAWLMAFAAGIMVYVAIHELLPMARQYKKPGWLFVGVLASVAVYVSLITLLPA